MLRWDNCNEYWRREAEGKAGELTTHHPLEHVDYRVDTVKEEDKSTNHR